MHDYKVRCPHMLICQKTKATKAKAPPPRPPPPPLIIHPSILLINQDGGGNQWNCGHHTIWMEIWNYSSSSSVSRLIWYFSGWWRISGSSSTWHVLCLIFCFGELHNCGHERLKCLYKSSWFLKRWTTVITQLAGLLKKKKNTGINYLFKIASRCVK